MTDPTRQIAAALVRRMLQWANDPDRRGSLDEHIDELAADLAPAVRDFTEAYGEEHADNLDRFLSDKPESDAWAVALEVLEGRDDAD